jgi:catecholate siderophore receptor
MFNHTPLATALALAFAVPFATPAVAQTAPQTASQPSAQNASASAAGDNGTLPTIGVAAQAEQQDFQAERSNVGAKTPTALRDIPQTVTVIKAPRRSRTRCAMRRA